MIVNESVKILFCNFLAYLILFLCFFKKDSWKISVKNLPFLWLVLVSFSSFLFYIQPGFKWTVHYSRMTSFPLIYLFVCFVILFSPYRQLSLNYGKHFLIKSLPRKKVNLIIFLSLPVLLVLFVAYSIDAMNTNLADMQSVRENVYAEMGRNPLLSNWLGSSFARLFNQLNVLFYCLSFHILVFFEEKKFYHWIFIILPYVVGLEFAYSTATRSYVLFIVMLVLFQYLLYADFMNDSLRRRLKLSFVIIGGSLLTLVIGMSIARFADNDVMLFLYKYAGESMVNFDGLLFDHVRGTTDGMAYFWYFPSKLGAEIPYTSMTTKWAFIESHTGVPGLYFYTIVGAFIFEFGKYLTPVLIIILAWFMKHIFKKTGSARALIVVCWCTYNVFASVFLLPIQGDSGSLSILWLIAFYMWMGNKKQNGFIK